MAIALLLEQTCGEVFQTANVNWMDSSRDPVNVKKLVGAQKSVWSRLANPKRFSIE